MLKTNFEENLREVVGTYVIQLIQAQTMQNQLAGQLQAAEDKIKDLEAQLEGIHLVKKQAGVDNKWPIQPQPAAPSAPESAKDS